MIDNANRTIARASEAPVGSVAYLTGCYPMASHTFIQREIAALRRFGARIITVSVRAPGADHLTGPEERGAAAGTFYVLRRARNPLVLLRAGLWIIAAPRRTAAAVALAARTPPPGL